MHIITSGTANIQLKIDPSVVLATRQYVDSSINGLLPADKVAGIYTKVTVNDRGVFVSGSNPSTLAGMGITDTFTKAEIAAIIAEASALPVGTMVAFPVNKVAPGFLEIDGSVKSIATYPDLAAFLGTAFNLGNEGAGNFRLPESRGEFLRGWDHGRGVDAGRAIGSWQDESFKSHVHSATRAGFMSNEYPNSQGTMGTGGSVTYAGQGLQMSATAATGGSETRARNLAVMWCIKAWNAPINQGVIDIAALAVDVEKIKKIGVVGAHKKLKVSASGTNALVSVTADQLMVGSGTNCLSLSAVNLTINTATVGINGLDAGVLAASTWYSVWGITNGITIAGLLSLSETAPTLPAGYSHAARVSWIKTDGTANKYPLSFVQAGIAARYKVAAGSNIPNLPILVSGVQGSLTVPTWATVAIGAFVPPTASKLTIELHLPAATGCSMAACPNNAYGSVLSMSNRPPVFVSELNTMSYGMSAQGEILLESSNIYVASDAAASNAAIYGWEDNL